MFRTDEANSRKNLMNVKRTPAAWAGLNLRVVEG